MARFMVIHRNPDVSWEEIEENWIKLANVESATWERTWYNKSEGARYCLWHASDMEGLKELFGEMNIAYESILEVEETVPDIWKAFRYSRSPFPDQTRLR